MTALAPNPSHSNHGGRRVKFPRGWAYIYRDGRMDTTSAAMYLDAAPTPLAQWRSDYKGPQYYRVSGRVWYRKEHLDAWLWQAAHGPLNAVPVPNMTSGGDSAVLPNKTPRAGP